MGSIGPRLGSQAEAAQAVDGCVGLPMHVLGWDDSMLHQSARGRVGQVRSGGAIRDPSVWDVSSGVCGGGMGWAADKETGAIIRYSSHPEE